MKKRLLIISDLWGFDNSLWLENYIELLKSDFQLILYDSCKIAEIKKDNVSEKELHSQFTNEGIQRAVTNVLKLENNQVNVLAFSIGGTIAWKAALKGLKINKLYAVSSTRLRYEVEKPDGDIHLMFGEYDQFIPENSWFNQLGLECGIIENGWHEIYKNDAVINNLCNRIISDLNR